MLCKLRWLFSHSNLLSYVCNALVYVIVIVIVIALYLSLSVSSLKIEFKVNQQVIISIVVINIIECNKAIIRIVETNL